MLGIILLVLLIVLIVGALPSWPYMAGYSYGYAPSALIFVILLVVIVLIASGSIPFAWR